MTISLAFYKGPPTGTFHKLSHYAIRLWTWSKYSHAEIVVNGVCYSSSARDGGVRSKVIDLNTGKWDVVELALSKTKTKYILKWFEIHNGNGYDYLNIVRFIFPFVKHRKNKWVCFESIGASMGFPAAHKLTANDLLNWAIQNSQNSNTEVQ